MKTFLCLALVAACVSIAQPSPATPFDPAQFEAAQRAGKPVLVHVHADWCRTYARQKPIVEELLSFPMMKEYRHFTVDADRQKELLGRLKAYKTSTMIVYKGRQEVGRSIGQTDRNAIAVLLEKAL